MIIATIEAIPLRIPFRAESCSDAGVWGDRGMAAAESLLVKVTTDDGVTGWGEAFGLRATAAVKVALETMVAPACLGRDAGQIAPLMAEIRRTLHVFGLSGPVAYALSAIDIALWDIAGKTAGMPVYRLLGGSTASDLPCYASLIRYTDPALVADAVMQARAVGFQAIKLHEITLPAIRTAREAAGPDAGLMLDVNCAWTRAEARDMEQRLREFDPAWLEEPIWPPDDVAGLAWLRSQARVPIAAGENASTPMDFTHLLTAGAVDVVQPSPAKMGGLTELLRIAPLAAAHGVAVMPHSFYDGPGLLAAAHACAVLGPPQAMVEWRFFDLEASLYGADLLAGGRLRLPQGPGLGLDPDADVIARFRADR